MINIYKCITTDTSLKYNGGQNEDASRMFPKSATQDWKAQMHGESTMKMQTNHFKSLSKTSSCYSTMPICLVKKGNALNQFNRTIA